MEQVLFVADHYNCGGVFIMLDAATNASADSSARAGVFIKKTSPVSSQAANMKNYMLRGSAAIARAHNIESVSYTHLIIRASANAKIFFIVLSS